MNRLRDLLNPRHPAGHYVLPHGIALLLGLAIALLLAFAAGFWSGGAAADHGATFFAQRYDAPLTVVTDTIQTPKTSAPVALPAKGSIQTRYFPAVGNQGSLGACAAWATAEVVTYEYRIQHPGSWPKFSPKCMYDHYSITYSGGLDLGSWPPLDAEQIPIDGIGTFKAVPYPPNVVDPVYPEACRNTTYKQPIRFLTLGQGENEGQGAVDATKQQIAADHPVLIALPVYPEFDNAAMQPLLVSPKAGEQARGGHEVVFRQWDDSLVFPDGTVGGFELQNSWSRWWGAYNNRGRAWISYDFVRRFVYSIQVALLGRDAASPAAAPVARAYLPNAGQKDVLPPPPPGVTGSGSGYWARHVLTRDSGLDITRLINQAARRHHLWPLGIVATLATESGLMQISDRYGVWPDVSHGIAQLTDQTAIGRGYCADDYSCKVWAEQPAQSIEAAADLLDYCRRVTGLRFPRLYSAYNQGPFAPRAFLLHPPPGYAAQAYASYTTNLSTVRVQYG